LILFTYVNTANEIGAKRLSIMPQRQNGGWPGAKHPGYPARMDPLALAVMAAAFTFSSFVVLLGWR
jgi:hypothetical protein